MVLTLKAYRRCTPERNRRIPTIPAGCTDVGPANVSAVDTGPRRSESPGFVRQSPATPSRVLLHRSLAVVCAGSQWSWFDACPAQNWLEMARESPYSTRVGIHWPRVVPTARRPHLPPVHPTLLQ